MNDAKHAPLIWDFFKRIIAVTITAAIAVVIIWRLPLHEYSPHAGNKHRPQD